MEGGKKTKLIEHLDLLSGFAFSKYIFFRNRQKLVTPKNFTKNGVAEFNIENTKFTIEDFDEKYICKENDLLLLLTDLTPSCELLGKPSDVKKR
jgi:type I restriction enzyme S subunit